MKRAVSSVDASAASQCSTRRGKLKRCKSAFANLKRLGAVAAANSSSYGADATGEDSLLPRWRQHVSSPDVISSGAKAIPTLGGDADSFLVHSFGTATNTPSLGRLFGGEMIKGARSTRSPFAAPLNFGPLPEGEMFPGDDICSWHQLKSYSTHENLVRQRQDRSPQGHQDDIPEESDTTTAADCGSGSPGFSIVGFGNFFDIGAEDEEQEVAGAPGVRNPSNGRARWGAGVLERQGQDDVDGVGKSTPPVSHTYSDEGSAAGSTFKGVSGNAAGTHSKDTGVSSTNDNRELSSAEEHSSSMVMMRLQRRFEEMLLVSNVAT